MNLFHRFRNILTFLYPFISIVILIILNKEKKSSINKIFTKSNAKRGELPIGVSFKKKNNKYQASCSDGSNHKEYLGLYDTIDGAFEAYKQYKEQVIKDMADEYRDLIPEVLYNAMINYEVEIND